MILYANGCSHTAAAEAVVDFGFAEDDWELPNREILGRKPHPSNLAQSWCTHLSLSVSANLVCDAETASSNDRIIRTTNSFLSNYQGSFDDLFLIIQWSTWEREEWLYKDTWYQVNASGIDMVPNELADRYKNYIVNIDYYQKTLKAHQDIWNLHQIINQLGIRHLFFNSWNTFNKIPIQDRLDWKQNYLNPYDENYSFANILKTNGFLHTQNYHFGADGHRFWSNYLLNYIQSNNLL